MGLVEQLEYAYPSPNVCQRGLQRLAPFRFASWLLSKSLHHIDRMLLRVSGGRVSLPGLCGLPVITLETVGARSGALRTIPLLGIPVGSDLGVIGSGFGMKPTPAWVHNLSATPDATVQYRDRRVEVQARRPTSGETDQIWESARRLYPGFAAYAVMASHREISVFVLEPAVTG